MSRKKSKGKSRRGVTTTSIRPSPKAGYDAVVDKKKRTQPGSNTKSEDSYLTATQRRKMSAITHDQLRNFSLVGWMVRKQIDYVSRFGFQADTGDTGLDAEVEAFMVEAQYASAFDVTGRFNRQKFVSVNECLRILDGDMFGLKIASGHMQGIEGDRVRKARDLPEQWQKPDLNWAHGIVLNAFGKPSYYCICKRDGSQLRFDKMVRAHNVIPLSYIWRHDQWRGVSPLASAVALAQDTYETLDFAALKVKLHTLFGAWVKTKNPGGPDNVAGMPTVDDGTAETETDEGTTLSKEWKRFKPGAPAMFELAEDEEMGVIESSTPSFEFQGFTELEVHIILLALDIPFTFWDSRKSSYTARLGDNQQYMISAATKQEEQRSWHHLWTRWRLDLAINRDRLIRLPRGMDLSDMRWRWDATTPYPWTDMLKERKADMMAVQAGFNSPQRICRSRGVDHFEIIDEIARAREYAESKGVVLDFGAAEPPEQEPDEDEDEGED